MSVDEITQSWIRNRSDELAVDAGCRFDLDRAMHAVWWIERCCRLYEGASGPMRLVGCHECGDYGLPDVSSDGTTGAEWGDGSDIVESIGREREYYYSECFANGHAVDWQYECVMRIFGWVKHSAKLGRMIRRFRDASVWVAKKNKKSPTLAALALYLLIGDNESGQKVYLAAKDGTQVRKNIALHVSEMVKASDVLMADCKIDGNTLSVNHLPSKSWIIPLSSSNARTQKSKEGLNGSVLVDETHVVDRAFVGRISRAGISRDEPLHAEFSTAGDDPSSYGKERFDFACKVISGEVQNQGLFAAVYAAPQDTKDEDIEANPLKYAQMANPALGHTVDFDEFMHDLQQSKRSLEEFGKFKMYRLNVWQSSSSPYLRMSDWKRCEREFTEDEMLGRQCAIGFDMALKWDTTAIVCVFPWEEDGRDECYRVLPYFFMPRERAMMSRHQVPWLDYERDGFITLTDGDITDFRLIRKKLNELCGKFEVSTINYDRKFAESFCQTLQDEDGLPVAEFAQGPATFTEPMGRMEGLVISGGLHHPGNRVLDWQAANLTIKRGMPARPDAENHRKIDGMVALVMGLAGVIGGDEPIVCNTYDTPGSFAL